MSTASPILIWSVYHLFCRHTHPPKNKFVAIVCHEAEPMGFVINSRLNPFTQKRSHLLACHAPLLQNDHNFLAYDSWLDCQMAFPFETAELTDHRGVIHISARAVVLKAVNACAVLPVRHKLAITAANQAPTNPDQH